jgi:glycosyltransferase involved in cell wall biosynthesis
MNIVFITIAYPRTASEYNLYSDLMEEFAENGHNVYVVCSIEKRYNVKTNLTENKGIKVLRVQTGNITSNPNYIEKGIALLQLQPLFIRAIKQHFNDVSFDLIIYSTPPIQYNRIIKYLKKKSNAVTYLLLKDIFPQNAVDMGLLSKWHPVYHYFRRKEKETYRLSDFIGCMSPANVRYLLKHNPFLSADRVGICANSLKNRGSIDYMRSKDIRKSIREKFNISENDLLLIYGGNLGISQGLAFLLEILDKYRNLQHIKFLVVGEGTWYRRIENFLRENDLKNVILHKRVSPDEFKNMMFASDVGLIFLNPGFTIPNFPSRLTSYLEVGLPVIACTDAVSDVGNIIIEAGCGYKVISGDQRQFDSVVLSLQGDSNTRKSLANNARKLFEERYTTTSSYAEINNSITNKH